MSIYSNLSDNQIRAALKGVAGVRVLHFSSMRHAFGGFINFEDSQKFMHRTEQYMSLWCCTKMNGVPGHIWYDMWADVVPHTDRHMRTWNASWKTVLGP